MRDSLVADPLTFRHLRELLDEFPELVPAPRSPIIEQWERDLHEEVVGAFKIPHYMIGLPVRVSQYMPPPGWHDLPNAHEIRAENERILLEGGRLIDCAPARRYWGGMFVANLGTFVSVI